VAEEKRALRLDGGQFTRLIKITRATSRYAARDVLVLMLGHHTGMRVTEISRITIADVMHASGKLRQEVSLREAVTKGCRQRCAYLSSKGLIEAINEYLAYRVAHGVGTELDGSKYRGLLPHQPLIYGARGGALSQNTKRRTLDSGERRDYKACDSLQSHVTKLYKRAGIKGSSHSGRRGFAGKVLTATGDMDTVATLLGHSSIDCSQRYVDVDPAILQAMFADAIDDQSCS
jgi:site-specific recombinase XerD